MKPIFVTTIIKLGLSLISSKGRVDLLKIGSSKDCKNKTGIFILSMEWILNL